MVNPNIFSHIHMEVIMNVINVQEMSKKCHHCHNLHDTYMIFTWYLYDIYMIFTWYLHYIHVIFTGTVFKTPVGWWLIAGDYATHHIGNYNAPIRESLSTRIQWNKKRVLNTAHMSKNLRHATWPALSLGMTCWAARARWLLLEAGTRRRSWDIQYGLVSQKIFGTDGHMEMGGSINGNI